MDFERVKEYVFALFGIGKNKIKYHPQKAKETSFNVTEKKKI